jgi:hypothetical protein
MDNSIGLTTKYCTKKVDETEKARSLFGLERKRSESNGRKNQRFARRKQKNA